MAVIAASGMLGYILTTPQVAEPITEFYLLGPDHLAEGYPQELKAGVESQVIVGIVNHQGKAVTYRIVIEIDRANIKDTGPIILNNGEKREETIGFTPNRAGDNQKVEFKLYLNDEKEPGVRPLYLRVNVTE